MIQTHPDAVLCLINRNQKQTWNQRQDDQLDNPAIMHRKELLLSLKTQHQTNKRKDEKALEEA